VPDKRRHRGPHPKDREHFTGQQAERLKQAASDYGWLLSRGYSDEAALKLVGDRFQLIQRQRMALQRACCSETAAHARQQRRLRLGQLRGQPLAIDGFNCLITVEVLLSHGVLLSCQDGCTRDLASVHGTYRHVSETVPAFEKLCALLASAEPGRAVWYLDSPVSNSGKLAQLMRATFERLGYAWQVELVPDADRHVVTQGRVAASSDRWVLDHAPSWVDLPGELLAQGEYDAWLVDLGERVAANS